MNENARQVARISHLQFAQIPHPRSIRHGRVKQVHTLDIQIVNHRHDGIRVHRPQAILSVPNPRPDGIWRYARRESVQCSRFASGCRNRGRRLDILGSVAGAAYLLVEVDELQKIESVRLGWGYVPRDELVQQADDAG